MALSGNALAYGTVVVVGLALFAIGTPADRFVRDTQPASQVATPAYSVELNRRLTAEAASVGPHAAATTAAANGIVLRSVGFEFPGGARGFSGAAAELVTNNCTACHSPGMILTQPQLTRAEWLGEVVKMIRVYKAPVPQDNVDAIVAYLVSMPAAP